MKELSIEEKAKAYDEALEIIKAYYNRTQFSSISDSKEELKTIEKAFPELKESEDEKTKRVLHSIANKMSSHLRDIFTEEEFQCFDAWSYAWLKKQGEHKPWSEEDEDILNTIINYFKVDIECTDEDDMVRWLKSLKYRYTWKPSDEQMQALSDAGNSFRPFEEGHKVLWSLYNDLKKLKEE